jgi:hypothetical protein
MCIVDLLSFFSRPIIGDYVSFALLLQRPKGALVRQPAAALANRPMTEGASKLAHFQG